MNIYVVLLSFFISSAGAGEPVVLKPFLTDYCTSYPEGTREKPELWKHCCLEHDLYFWAGGSLEDRKRSDLRLKSCVEATGEIAQARMIYAAVALGGLSPVRFSTKQWGNAFEKRERYQVLSDIETAQLLHHLEINNSELSNILKQSFKEQLNSRLDSK